MRKQNHKKFGLLISLFLIVLLTFTSALDSAGSYKVNEVFSFTQPCSDASYMTLSLIKTPTTTIIVDENMSKIATGTFVYNYTPTETGKHFFEGVSDGCEGTYATYIEVTPTGTKVEDVGQISVGLIYFFIIMGFGLIFLGYLLLGNPSLWISYGGLFIMLLGSAFLYYDLHLANLYATTIAQASGAENVTTGAFLMVVRFLKLMPYIIAGIVAFASIRLLNKAIKKSKSSDGWDNGVY
jgi:hypothetical protein